MNFPNTLSAPPIECLWKSILYHTKNTYFWIWQQNFCYRISHCLKLKGILWKIIAACDVSKVLLLHRYFSAFSKNRTRKLSMFFKVLQSISTSHSLYHSNSCVLLIDTTNERCRFSIQELVVMLLMLAKGWATPM